MRKIILSCIIICIVLINICSYTYAAFDESTSIWDVAKEWIQDGREHSQDIPQGKTEYWSNLAGLLTGIGIWVVLISGSILGIRFMLASPDDKAEVKKSLKIWLIGAIVIFGALTIWRTAISILDIF